MRLTVRRIRPDERETLQQIRLAALKDSPDAYGRTFEEESAYPDAMWDERTTSGASSEERATFFAEIDGEPVGMAGYGRDEDGTYALYAMWVRPDVRRSGAARALVQAVLDRAGRDGARTIKLSVTEGNDAAFRLYESCGFTDTGIRESLRDGSPLSVIVMERALT